MIYGVIGLILGGIIGGCVATSINGKEYQKRIKYFQGENKRLRDENRKLKKKELNERDDEATRKEIENEITREDISVPEDDDDEDDEDEFDFDDPFPEEDDIPEAPIKKSEKKESDFYSMTKEEFEEDLSFRDSETITYYQQDGVFVDELNATIDNAEELLDKKTLEDVKTTDEDYLYSGNDWEDKMYEIIIEKNQSFYRDVMAPLFDEEEDY